MLTFNFNIAPQEFLFYMPLNEATQPVLKRPGNAAGNAGKT
ncbi:MAG: hypothetical protein QG577_1985, partial [Thermodesulfobacteriota bacterium]|nr:hypothetical protein [Thermodesulfobacteriota bacterium]